MRLESGLQKGQGVSGTTYVFGCHTRDDEFAFKAIRDAECATPSSSRRARDASGVTNGALVLPLGGDLRRVRHDLFEKIRGDSGTRLVARLAHELTPLWPMRMLGSTVELKYCSVGGFMSERFSQEIWSGLLEESCQADLAGLRGAAAEGGAETGRECDLEAGM